MDYKTKFIKQWEVMQDLPMIACMANTVEASPWHREENVLIHTKMVVDQFLSLWDDVEDRSMYLAAFAAVFHDVGKPDAEETVESEARGVYRRYAGHEHLSAVAWLDFYMSLNDNSREKMDIGEHGAAAIAWMIEYHLPYDIRDKRKRKGLRTTVEVYDILDAFCALLRADSRGRISDDHETKLARVEDWIKEFREEEVGELSSSLHPEKVAFVLMGTSSSGKSTVRSNLARNAEIHRRTVGIYSKDDVRVATFPSEGSVLEQYEYAFRQSIGDGAAEFKVAVDAALKAAFESNPDVVISDECNLSKKVRTAFIQRAKQKGYHIHVVWLMTHPNVALQRQAGRDDRVGVPIWKQFEATTVPSYFSEMDEFTIILPKID